MATDTALEQRTLPHNAEAERTVLGAVLVDNSAFNSAAELLTREDFYREVTQHSVPNNLDAVKVLASAPAVLDLYMWLSYRCFKAKGPESIPIFGPVGLVSQLGSVEYSRPRRFRAMIEQWLGVIRAMWPQCPARVSQNGQSLLIDHAPAVIPALIDNGRIA